jgi:hypothetical protein
MSELTMTSNVNRSPITKLHMEGVQRMLRFMTNNAFWEELNASYNASQQILSDFMRRYPLMGERAGGSRKKKSVKKILK